MAFRFPSIPPMPSFLVAVLILLQPIALQAQLPDAFVSHFGASRTREKADMWSGSAGILLLSQYGSRWKDPPAFPQDTVTDYDQLDTTVGYNYLTGGRQMSLFLGRFTLVGSLAGTVGVTSDKLTKPGQDGIHNYMRYPHVRRGNVSSGDLMIGTDVEVGVWYSRYWNPVTVDLMANVATTMATHHGEISAGLGLGLGWWIFRAQATAEQSLWIDQNIKPALVANRLKSSYWRWSGLVTIDRNAYRFLKDLLPAIGAGVSSSSGLFPGEKEFLLSVFLEFPAGPNATWRFEHVNDVLKDKDRGPTGGLRVVYVRR